MIDDTARVLAAIRGEVEQATDTILSAVSEGLGLVAQARRGEPHALDALDAALCVILEACAFQDLVGQSLSRLEPATLSVRTPDDPLLQGPHGLASLDQAQADALLAAAGLSFPPPVA